jgi:hypothetical protein
MRILKKNISVCCLVNHIPFSIRAIALWQQPDLGIMPGKEKCQRMIIRACGVQACNSIVIAYKPIILPVTASWNWV